MTLGNLIEKLNTFSHEHDWRQDVKLRINGEEVDPEDLYLGGEGIIIISSETNSITRERRFQEQGMNFLKRFNFDRLRWDGEEVTVWTRMNEPMSKIEFRKGSKTWDGLEDLERLAGSLRPISVIDKLD